MTSPGRLVGHWKLESYTEEREDGSLVDVLGPDPKGYIQYMEGGRMSVLFAASGRKRFSGAWADVPIGQKGENFDLIVAYGGRYSDLGDRVVHHVEVCWIPNWEGRDLERFLTFLPGDRVILRTPAVRNGRRPLPVQHVTFRRIPAGQ